MGRKKIKKWAQCAYCLKWVPKKYLANHENTCRVRRGLDPKPEELEQEGQFIAKPGESIQELLDRARANPS